IMLTSDSTSALALADDLRFHLFLFNDTPTIALSTLSLHDALPIFNHTSRGSISTSTLPSIKLRKCSSKIITSILSFISGRLGTKSNQIKQLIRNGRSASLQRTFKKSFTSFSHSTRNKTRDGLIRVRNIRALNGRFNTSITHAYSIVIGSKHITLNATGGGF